MPSISLGPFSSSSTPSKTAEAMSEKLAAQRVASIEQTIEMQKTRRSKEARTAEGVEVYLSAVQAEALADITYEKLKGNIEPKAK